MADVKWLANRLKAMNAPEVLWRLGQRRAEGKERSLFSVPVRVDSGALFSGVEKIALDWRRLPLNSGNADFTAEREIELLGPYGYAEYRTRWHAGFQTEGNWPLEFSYDLDYKGRDDVGDARTNWELNRCSQFALLAKGWHATREASFLDELGELEDDWAASNPFLYGIAWTSTMEFAIRSVNWMYAAAFLFASDDGSLPDAVAVRVHNLAARFSTGAANMAAYVARHYSRYSSANNHVIVEACCLGLAGLAYSADSWVETADEILSAEIPRQNHPDGVNREQSLHYQAFFMEAVGLYAAARRANGLPVPGEWRDVLVRMSRYVQDCHVAPGVWLVFGDDDEGAILNLCGPKPDACEYALQLMGAVLDVGERWSDYEGICEILRWILPEGALATAAEKPLRDTSWSTCYPDGGVTVMRSVDGRVVVGVDHGPLGFGSIAAHGHADALSFQYFVDGRPVVTDPGTFIYHCDRPIRDALRSTAAHSTVCVDGHDQSEILGAFMWGGRAECTLEVCELGGDVDELVVSHDGYAPAVHRREFLFDRFTGELTIADKVEDIGDFKATWSLPLGARPVKDGADWFVGGIASIHADGVAHVDIVPQSIRYAEIEGGYALVGELRDGRATLVIAPGDRIGH